MGEKPKAKVVPLMFPEANERERKEFSQQVKRLEAFYGEEASFMPVKMVGEYITDADAIVFPQLLGAAFGCKEILARYDLPMVVLTSQFGTVEMWDWEIVAFLRSNGMNVFSPYNIELAKVVLRAIAVKKKLRNGAKFLMFQDSPGEGMQANIFKRFYWWEKECTEKMQSIFGIEIVYKSFKELSSKARCIKDEEAQMLWDEWEIKEEGVNRANCLKAAKIYIAVKNVINELGGVEGVGANCLNESFHCDTTPCLAWNMLFEKDDIICCCEGDSLTMLSTYVLYRTLKVPIMMTNIYPFLVGMAALAHEKITEFPDIADSDNHALGVHCGYFGLIPRKFCTSWTMRPKVLEIVNEDAIVIDCEMPVGQVTLAKIHPDFIKLSVIEATIEKYVQYPGSDARNAALIHYKDGEKVMEELCSHHAMIITGNQNAKLQQICKVFGWEPKVL